MYTQSQSSDPSIFSAIHVSGEGLPSSGLSDHFDRGADRVSTKLQQQEKRFKLTGYVCFFLHDCGSRQSGNEIAFRESAAGWRSRKGH